MPKSSIVHDPVLLRESLTIERIICLASGKPDWPPTDEFWVGIQADLKDACERRDLPYSPHPHIQHRALYTIRLLDLWNFLINKDQRWQPLRDFCRRWEQARGVTLSSEHTEQADGLTNPLLPSLENKSQLAPEPPHRGTPKDKAKVGRPSRRKEIQRAYNALVSAGEIDFKSPKTATYEPIRQKVRKVLGDEVAGLGDEAIRIVIAPLFDSAKAARPRQGGEA